jgi:uncharacterized protein
VTILDSNGDGESAQLKNVRALLSSAKAGFSLNPFNPHPVFRGGHAQTLAAYAWPRQHQFQSAQDEERVFDTATDVQVLGHCRWQDNRTAHPTTIIWHGIEGSSASTYMLTMADKLFAEGFNVVRMNLRTCGGTEHLTPTIYHGGLTDDLHEVVGQLIENDHLTRIMLVGFSLGGNMVLKVAGEYGAKPPKEVLAVCAVSPSIDLTASAALILKRSNWIYNRDFVSSLKKRIRLKHKLYPDRYDISGLWKIRTLREFDNRFTARAHGFADAEDYYYKASSIRVINRIQIPTLIIHAHDDPFIPFAPMRDPALTNNPYILLVDTERGGHVAFLSGEPMNSDVDRFWAENRVVDFLRLTNQQL